MSSGIQRPGVFWVQSRLSTSRTDVLDESTFLKWYDEDHIPEVISTSGIKSGFRYINVNRSSTNSDGVSPPPFLAFYPMSDIAFTLSEEFNKISVHSDILPGGGIVYDFADFDVNCLEFLDTSTKRATPAAAQYIVTSMIRAPSDVRSEVIDGVYKKQTTSITHTTGHFRTLRFQSQYARTNSQSRALKGLPATEEAHPDPATWLTIHEFSEAPDEGIIRSLRDSSKDALFNGESLHNEVHVWNLVRVQGLDNFFA